MSDLIEAVAALKKIAGIDEASMIVYPPILKPVKVEDEEVDTEPPFEADSTKASVAAFDYVESVYKSLGSTLAEMLDIDDKDLSDRVSEWRKEAISAIDGLKVPLNEAEAAVSTGAEDAKDKAKKAALVWGAVTGLSHAIQEKLSPKKDE